MPRVMEIVTPLGEDVLLFHTMSAREEMSRLFEYQLDLLSTRDDINLDEILGKNVTVKVALSSDETRFFNGFVTRFAEGGTFGRFRRYSATVRPWLWLLTRTSDCRIFQEQTVPEIIKTVFADHGVADFKFELTSTFRKWTYCVQYRETDFNFLSRTLEQYGVVLLLQVRGRQAHAGAGPEEELSRLRGSGGHLSAGDRRAAAGRPHHQLAARLRVRAGEVEPHRLQLRDARRRR